MPELEQVMEDFGKNSKKLFKNKWFLIAAGGVGVVALIVALRKNSSGETDEYLAGYEPVGYGGYPTVSGGSEGSMSYDAIYDDSYYGTGSLDSDAESIYLEMAVLSDAVTTLSSMNESTIAALEREKAISQMRANSELYNQITDPETKKALHDENLAIAEKFGWTFGEGGNYYEGNSVVYLTTKQQVTALEGTKTTTTATFQNNVDYQKAINEAIMSGADAATINALNDQRNAKIAATGVTNPNSSYDKNFDYAAAIAAATKAGASQSVIDNLTAQRNAKIAGENLNPDGSKKTTSSGTTKTTSSGTTTKTTSSGASVKAAADAPDLKNPALYDQSTGKPTWL